ncbi:hypothetical protein LDJ81_12220 [Lentilactobacillus parabuchneri]|uniref:Uncharacterized protein n=5 Tax=Lactobacillales TaxID=186826 RepID=A0A1X1FAR9_9LACO|nr:MULTISPECIES: hypothetical protein [Lentilactobacillus]RRG00505.1 MAG: hypothetical protein DUD34_15215 [Lactobacillus sp.]EEI69748.1 hypothetical protein HMPREF0496_3008 [Lentilactobacillus hilgardii ATCC 27305]EHL97289.1 hypothetical protein HMPREF9103_02027 [Lentilactobacillus parafarraginis F0439]MCP9369967.1 hypothetical protein [Lentilactobacillus kefiri]MCT3399638.1 hypothetical protein [Lentilactobacillus hilgardii]
MTLTDWSGFALLSSLVYWWFLMWNSFNLTRKTLVLLNTVGTLLMTVLTWSITYGMLLIPILIVYAISIVILFKLPLPAKKNRGGL